MQSAQRDLLRVMCAAAQRHWIATALARSAKRGRRFHSRVAKSIVRPAPNEARGAWRYQIERRPSQLSVNGGNVKTRRAYEIGGW